MRLRTTHTATVYGETVVGEDDLGADLTEDEPVATVPCRYRPAGEGFVREATGERVHQNPTLITRPRGRTPTGEQVALLETIDEGQRVAIDGIAETFTVRHIRPQYGRGSRPRRLTIELVSQTEGTDGG